MKWNDSGVMTAEKFSVRLILERVPSNVEDLETDSLKSRHPTSS
jgi:hypothetical protein